MSKITVSFRLIVKSGKKKRKLRLCAKLFRDTRYVPKEISLFGQGSLKDYDWEDFDQKAQRFKEGAKNAADNNALLESVKEKCEQAISEHDPSTVQELWNIMLPEALKKPVDEPKTANEPSTWGEFLEALIGRLKGCKGINRLPSGNFRVYVPLLHYLEQENSAPGSSHIINAPIKSLGDPEFKLFGEFLRRIKNPNYLAVMKYFKRAHNAAIRAGYADTPLKYRYQDDVPPKTYEQMAAMNKGISSLTPEQIEAIEGVDLSKIPASGPRQSFFKRLYLDAALLMYYLYSRPMDIFSLKVSDIRQSPKGAYIEYLPQKKKNSPNAIREFVKCPINKKAMEIIKRYWGQSSAGYLLPFSENMRAWDLADPEEYHTRYNRCNCMLGKVNVFLKKIASHLGIFFYNDTLSMYVFRHSAITNAINSRGLPPMMVAKIAGTSLRELERSYMDHTTGMFDFDV